MRIPAEIWSRAAAVQHFNFQFIYHDAPIAALQQKPWGGPDNRPSSIQQQQQQHALNIANWACALHYLLSILKSVDQYHISNPVGSALSTASKVMEFVHLHEVSKYSITINSSSVRSLCLG